jgi:carbon starvation protein
MKIMFFIIVFLALLIVIAIFGLVIAVIFDMYPAAVLPVWLQIPIAIVMGRMIRGGTANLTKVTAVAVAAMYGGIALGYYLPMPMPEIAGLPATGVWTVLLLIYAYIASTLSVTTLLQPRDFINAWQLMVAMALLVVGIFVAAPVMVAPAFNLSPEGAPPWMPFLFITIACGAISGFHCLVSSGTTSKQVETEPDARFVGYGSMLTEGFLATIVLIACGGGLALAYTAADGEVLTGSAAFATHYGSWMASSGLGSKIGAFVEGSANMIAAIGLPKEIGMVLMGVFVASFAGTTLDTSTRLQRYVISELAVDLKIEALQKRHPATLLAVVTAIGLAFYNGAGGKGALLLWPLFGSINQLLAGLALIVVSYWLKQQGRNYFVTLLPSLIILVFTSWALTHTLGSLYDAGNIPGLLIGSIALLLQIWLTIEGLAMMLRSRDTEAIPATGG